jgi:HlyD family secretion protein
VDRQAIRSPVDGVVMACESRRRRSAVAGAAILDVVPSNEMLVVEARIRPQDINHVRRCEAKVRLAATTHAARRCWRTCDSYHPIA